MVFTKFCSVDPAFLFFLSLAVGNCCCGISISYSNHFLANRQSKTSTYNLHASAYWWVSEMVTTPCWVEMQMTLKLRSKQASHELMSMWHYMAQEIQPGFSVKQVGFLHWSGKPQPLARSAIIVSDAMKEERMLSFKHHFVRTAGFKLGMLRHIKVRDVW